MRFFPAILLLLTGCASQGNIHSSILHEATRDLICGQVEVSQVSEGSAMQNKLAKYRASGCGKSKDYIVNGYGNVYDADTKPAPSYYNSFKFEY